MAVIIIRDGPFDSMGSLTTGEIAAHRFAMLAMTPNEITAVAYFVRGKQGGHNQF